MWAFFEANRDDLERASTAVLSLSGLGDERVLPYVRQTLQARDGELVSNAVAGLISLGELEDVDRLRLVHLRFMGNREIRMGPPAPSSPFWARPTRSRYAKRWTRSRPAP